MVLLIHSNVILHVGGIQMAETPTLYGKDAEAVLKQIEQTPSKQQIDSLVKKLEQKFQNIETTRQG